jgi:hypothetical protein
MEADNHTIKGAIQNFAANRTFNPFRVVIKFHHSPWASPRATIFKPLYVCFSLKIFRYGAVSEVRRSRNEANRSIPEKSPTLIIRRMLPWYFDTALKCLLHQVEFEV